MDRTTRWETEAIRGVGAKRQTPPKPTRKRTRTDFTDNRHWVTLREAEEATGIPVNTLRKWVRKADLPSYLEADGDLALRMVDLDAVIARAKELGRSVTPQSQEQSQESRIKSQESGSEAEPSDLESASESATMIVPIDAWNKMLNQLGNLHEAGQQLAEARERAAKAETEAKFLREQLAENRAKKPDARIQKPEIPDQPSENKAEPTAPITETETTSYWRYLTTGWRDRNRRR